MIRATFFSWTLNLATKPFGRKSGHLKHAKKGRFPTKLPPCVALLSAAARPACASPPPAAHRSARSAPAATADCPQ